MQEKQYIVEGSFMINVQAGSRHEAQAKAIERLKDTEMVATVVQVVKNE